MHQSIPRSSLSSITRTKIYQVPSICTRALSTSQALSTIGPESPKFIEIPRPPQRHVVPPLTIKGTLPPPRNLFPRRAGDKISPSYLAAATPEPTAHHHLSEPATAYIAWKRRMAASRRQNLREGLLELHKRKARSDKLIAQRSFIRRQNREARIRAPTREDERLTAPTITAAMRTLQLGNIADPNRTARLQAAAERVAARAKMLVDRRRDALHTLYMHARSFITTEKQLEETIEEIFVEKPWAHVAGKESSNNIWDAEGAPATVQDMLSEVNNTQKAAVSYHRGPAAVTGKRMLRIAEELTGGKMD